MINDFLIYLKVYRKYLTRQQIQTLKGQVLAGIYIYMELEKDLQNY